MLINPRQPQQEAIRLAAQVILAGGIVLHPTDTVYGLGCNPFDGAALARLLSLKARSPEKGFLVLIGARHWSARLAETLPDHYTILARALWPGPVTFLLAGRKDLPAALLGAENRVGVRLPDHPFLRKWVEAVGGPVVSTSANRSGEPTPASVADLKARFEDRVDLFLEAGDLPPGTLPSTVVDLTCRPPCIIREGRQLEKVRACLARGG